MLEMLSVAFPELRNVTDCAGLVVFTVWLAKVNEVGDRLTVELEEETPVPVRLTN